MKIPIPKKDIVAITANNKKKGFTFFNRIHSLYGKLFFRRFQNDKKSLFLFYKKKI
jgi:hypothetical protein